MEQVSALGVVTDLPTAAAVFGLSRATAYTLARQDRFPVPVFRVGRLYRVSVAALVQVLDPATCPPPGRSLDPPGGPSVHGNRAAALPAANPDVKEPPAVDG